MIDITRFIRLRPEGCASVVREPAAGLPPDSGEPIFHLVFKRFNPENGRELEPERQLLREAELRERRTLLADELQAIDAILSEIKGLE